MQLRRQASITIGIPVFASRDPQKDDIEAPCINRIEEVRRDMKDLALAIYGKLTFFDDIVGHRFRSGQITPDGSSFKFYVQTLKGLGFDDNWALDHREGQGLQKRFPDGPLVPRDCELSQSNSTHQHVQSERCHSINNSSLSCDRP